MCKYGYDGVAMDIPAKANKLILSYLILYFNDVCIESNNSK